MKIVFASNFINHHQLPFCEALAALCKAQGGAFAFWELEEMDEERRSMGWGEGLVRPAYVHARAAEGEAALKEAVREADILLIGGAGLEEEVHARLLADKPVLRISERIYREGQWKRFSPRGLLHKHREYLRDKHRPYYLLCNGAYVASDFSLIGAFPEKMFRFGYFPEEHTYAGGLPAAKAGPEETGPVRCLFAARMIPLKHPEYPLRLARAWKEEGRSFHLTMVGDGELLPALTQAAAAAGLEETVTFTGMLPPADVRKEMEAADVFFFCSNHLEGWGTVMNEAMNSGCALVASVQAGGSPYLVSDEPGQENGVLFDGSYADFAAKATALLDDRECIRRMGQAAMATIAKAWNPTTAAERVYAFCEALLSGKPFAAPADGPMSRAAIVAPPAVTERAWDRIRL